MATLSRCYVCGVELTHPKSYGDRHYCEEHHGLFADDIRSVWRATAQTFAVIVLLVVILAIGNQFLGDIHPLIRLAIGVGTAIFPSAAWISLFYFHERNSSTDYGSTLPILFVLGILVAAAATRPFLYELIDIDTWLWQANASNRFLGNILLNGFYHMFVIYGIVRYAVWQTPQFFQRAHGIVYGLAVGIGYAGTLNLLFVLEAGGLSILNGGLRLITQLCAFIAPTLVTGYYLGRSRFEDMPIYYPLMGQILAAGINGLLLYAGNELNSIRLGFDQDGFSPWPGAIFCFLVTIAAYGAVYGLLQRHNKLTKARIALSA